MGILDDTAVFAAVIQQGGFSHAARHLGISNGMVSRRIAQLEADLGVTLLKRTTRQIQLTPEGEIFWQHAQRIQQEMDAAVGSIQSASKKPKGMIRLSAPLYFGRYYLTPVLMKFMANFPEIEVNVELTNKRVDPVKEKLDLVIRGSGFLGDEGLEDSSMKMKLLVKEKNGLYVSPAYIANYGEPQTIEELKEHKIIGFTDKTEKWKFQLSGKKSEITVAPSYQCNDTESRLIACASGFGIGKFTDLNVKAILEADDIRQILTGYDWGSYHLYAVYPQQKTLPQRTRLLLDFIVAHTQNLQEKIDT